MNLILITGPDLDEDINGLGLEGGRKAHIGWLNNEYAGKCLVELNARRMLLQIFRRI